MKCPTLVELPPSPHGKTGWLWTVESLQTNDLMSDGNPLPRVTVVTPSFNQAQFIEETIRSVLLQSYPNLEYIIMDGGSTDGSLEIIKKYAPWLAYWESEEDWGQSHAINKGWQRATGEILAWLNSDDLYTPNAVQHAVGALLANPSAYMVYSDCLLIDDQSAITGTASGKPFTMTTLLSEENYIYQPTVFLRRRVIENVGLLDENLHLIMDLDYWYRIGLQMQDFIKYLHGTKLAMYRRHSNAKTFTSPSFSEKITVLNKIFTRALIPKEVAAVRSLAFGRVYYNDALDKAKRHQGLSAITCLINTMRHSPKLIAQRPLDSIWIIKETIKGLFDQQGQS